jgi:hypothetical protein
MEQFFNNRTNRIGIIILQLVASAFALWQLGVEGPYQDLAITLMIPTSLLLFALSAFQLKKYF